jgi:putative endonuclease
VSTKKTGQFGESEAEKFVKSLGFSILEKNFNVHKIGEIDIIAENERTRVFFEVKYRRTEKFGLATESITVNKMKRLRKAANVYLSKNPTEKECRFDLIALQKDQNELRFEHFENIF